jgi:hypothetical protein
MRVGKSGRMPRRITSVDHDGLDHIEVAVTLHRDVADEGDDMLGGIGAARRHQQQGREIMPRPPRTLPGTLQAIRTYWVAFGAISVQLHYTILIAPLRAFGTILDGMI